VLNGGELKEGQTLPAEWRDYILVSKFGWTKQEIDEQPAVWLDWLISIDKTVEGVKANAQNV
jgi:hypothetical protein